MTDSPDAITAATVRALAAARGMTHPDVASGAEIPLSTFERRLSKGGWTIDEGNRLAALFGVGIDDLTTGLGGQLIPEGGGGQ